MERISFPISLHGNGSQHGRHGEFRQCATLSPFSGVQRLAHEIGQDALFLTERFITNMERNIDGPSSLCGSAQSTNTASLNGGNNPGIGFDISASKAHSTWERGADAPCKKSQQRRRPPQTDAVSCPLLELEAYIASRLLGPNAGTQCWMFAQCDFPICHAHQAEWRVVSRNPSSQVFDGF